MSEAILEIQNLHKNFPVHGGFFGGVVANVQAVRGVTLKVSQGETLGLVGESGCGKSTLGFLALRLLKPDSGKILFDGHDITTLSESHLRPLRREMQIVFQDPYASLNPRMTVGEIIGEPLLVHKIGNKNERKERAIELIRLVGLAEDAFSRYPHEFSGGQRQRVGIARAIALNPKLIVADEPVSALDLSVRGGILNLMSDLREKFSLSYLFISHDLKVVEHICHRICVMYLGEVMEVFPATGLCNARHPYTSALVSAIPNPDPSMKKKRIVLHGDVPSPLSPPDACSFHPRCPYAKEICSREKPLFEEYIPGSFASCHFIREMNGCCATSNV